MDTASFPAVTWHQLMNSDRGIYASSKSIEAL